MYFKLLILKKNIMKKLKRLQINLEKVMKNEELLTLRGGYSGLSCFKGTDGGPAFQLMCSDCSYHFMTVTDLTQGYC